MSIEKKSLISTLKSTKKANLASEISHDQITRTAGTKASPVAKLSAKAPSKRHSAPNQGQRAITLSMLNSRTGAACVL